MPHFSIEYSANLESLIDMKNFCDLIRKAGLETKVFPMAGIRVRALKCEHFSIADNDPNNGFIDISIRLREGRDLEIRKMATNHIFEIVENYLKPIMENHPLALSMEMRNIDAELSPKTNSIRKFLK